MFPLDVIDKIGFYVYRLIDPRNGETFYIGKGKGNRVFEHVKGAVGTTQNLKFNLEDTERVKSEKIQRIREIMLSGFEVSHVIHRHGLDSDTAYEVEAALIDAYPGISNTADGHANAERGAMHYKEIIQRYIAYEIDFLHKCLLIKVPDSALNLDLYEATRKAWKLSLEKAKKAELVLSIYRGLVVGVFKPKEWYLVIEEPGRIGFHGEIVSPLISDHYFGKRLPDRFRKKGMASPVLYSWKDNLLNIDKG